MTHVNRPALAIAFGIGLAASYPALAQSSQDLASVPQHGPATEADALDEATPDPRRPQPPAAAVSTESPKIWRFDAGGAVVISATLDAPIIPVIPGGWFSVGFERLRVHVNYDLERERYEDFWFYPYKRVSTLNQTIRVAAAWHFRPGRRFTPHLLGGVLWWSHSNLNCQQTAHLDPPCEKIAAFVVAQAVVGAGIDISVGSRFFVRTQVSAQVPFVPAGRAHVGVGVRF